MTTITTKYSEGELLYNIESLRNDIAENASTLEEAQDSMDEYMTREWDRDKAEVAKVLAS